jgi:hypothetical protein
VATHLIGEFGRLKRPKVAGLIFNLVLGLSHPFFGQENAARERARHNPINFVTDDRPVDLMFANIQNGCEVACFASVDEFLAVRAPNSHRFPLIAMNATQTIQQDAFRSHRVP